MTLMIHSSGDSLMPAIHFSMNSWYALIVGFQIFLNPDKILPAK